MNALSRTMDRNVTLGQSLSWLALSLVLLTLGAHFYRAGEYGIALCALGMIAFLSAGSGWKPYAAALFLCWGALEWGDSAYALARMRLGFGMPWLRGTAILLAVGALTALAGWFAFRRADAKERAKQREQPGSPLLQGLVFMAVFLALFCLRKSAPLNFLLLERYLPVLGSMQIFFAAWYGAFVAGQLLEKRKSRAFRKAVWLLFACVFFTQFFLGLLNIPGMLLTGKLHAPIPAFIIFAPIFRESFSMMPIIVLIATLLAGSAWCSHLCYFGPFDSLTAGNKAARPLPPFLAAAQTWGRPAVLVAGSLAALGLRYAGLDTPTAVSIVVVFALASLLIMAALSRRYGVMVHCTTFCPTGLVVNLLGRLSPWRIRVDASRCDNCGACEKICRYSAIDAEIRSRGATRLRCSLCRDCTTVCKNNAVAVHCPGLAPENAKKLFVGLAASLHALFLCVAMV